MFPCFETKQELLEIRQIWEYVKVVNYILNRKLLRQDNFPQNPLKILKHHRILHFGGETELLGEPTVYGIILRKP